MNNILVLIQNNYSVIMGSTFISDYLTIMYYIQSDISFVTRYYYSYVYNRYISYIYIYIYIYSIEVQIPICNKININNISHPYGLQRIQYVI